MDAEQPMGSLPPGEEAVKTASGGGTRLESSAGGGGCFDCNICLDFAVDPVVTLCGHLYCWPCIYKWLQVDRAGAASPASCPVCKAFLREDSLVPLYGRGHPQKQQPKGHGIIPRRPSLHQQQTHQHHLYPYPEAGHGGELFSSLSSSSSYTSPEVLGSPRRMTSTTGGLPWIFRNHQAAAAAAAGGRRQEMRVVRCLNQIWVSLICCTILFLLLF